MRVAHDGVVANPNCSTIPLTCVLKPLHDAAGLARVRVATYQSVSGAGAQRMERLRAESRAEHDLAMDWEFDGDEFDEESKLRAETRKILELPELPLRRHCVRVPVLVGHAQAVWVETEEPLSADEARDVLGSRTVVSRSRSSRRPGAAGGDDVLVGRIRPDRRTTPASLSRLRQPRKGAALNAIQIAELLLERRLLPA